MLVPHPAVFLCNLFEMAKLVSDTADYFFEGIANAPEGPMGGLTQQGQGQSGASHQRR